MTPVAVDTTVALGQFPSSSYKRQDFPRCVGQDYRQHLDTEVFISLEEEPRRVKVDDFEQFPPARVGVTGI